MKRGLPLSKKHHPVLAYGLRTLFVALLVVALGFGLSRQAPSRADFDDTPALRTTSAVPPTGTNIEIQVDDSEWAQTVLLVDDDDVATIVDPLDVGYSLDEQYSYRFYLQGLHNIGFGGKPEVDCPVALAVGAINLWDTANCAASPSAALLGEADVVIWYTGNNGPPLLSTTLSAGEVTDLTTYLSGGGNLFLQSHGYLLESDSCLGAAPYTSPVPSPGCISATNAGFINTYLGADEFTMFARTAADTRTLTYDPVTGDPIADAGDPSTLVTRRTASYRETLVTNVSTTAAASGVLTDNDADFGGTLAADSNFVMTRTDDGTARVVFTALYLENQFNQPDPDNFRTLFERSMRYLSDAPTVSVTNTRTSDSVTVDLSNSGLGVSTGLVDPASVNAAAGDQLVTTFTQSSPAATSVTSTTTIVDTTPVSFTDSSGTPYTVIPVPGTLFVQVSDPDHNTTAGADSFAVTVASDLGDSESVTVTETGGATSIFRSAAVPTNLTDTTADNGTLGVADGGTVSMTYNFLGNEQTKTFTQSAWEGGTTDSSTTVDTSGFDERDDQTAINSDELGYFVIDDPDELQTDWIKNNFAPHVNPQISPFTGIAVERFDSAHAFGSAVVREPATGDYYMWYTGEDSGGDHRIGLAISEANTTAPVGREFIKYPDNETYLPVIDFGDAPASSWWECGVSSPSVAINSSIAFGVAGHFIMFFAGTDCGGSLSRIGRATSADGITWSVDADPISETVPGAPLEAPFNAGGDFNPSLLYVPALHPLTPYMLWYDDGTLIEHTRSLTGAAGTWTVPTTALTVSTTGDEWDDASVTAPSVVYLLSQDLYIMYYEGGGGACGDPTLFLPAIGRAQVSNPTTTFAKPVAPVEQAGICGEKDGGIPGPPDPPTYENIVLRPPTAFGTWEFVSANPMLLTDAADDIDRLWFDSPTESGRSIGLAWNMEADPDGTLHSNPIDTDSAGFTTVGFGPLDLTHLGHLTADLSARTSDTLSDLLFDPAPDLAYPAGSPFAVNGALLSDFTGVANGERYIQYRVELAQDENPGMAPFETPPSNLVFSDAVEEISLDVYQRENLTQVLALPAELAATDAVVRITDVTFTLDPTEISVSYDLSSALDESTKRVVDPSGGEVLPGDQLDYTIMVRNSASIPLTDVTVRDEVPLGTVYLSGSIFGEGADDSGAPTLRWDLGTLDPGESVTIGFSVTVRDDVGQGSQLLNQAFINSAETGVIPTENPTTPVQRDPTIIAVGAKLAILLAAAAVAAGAATFALDRRRSRRAGRGRKQGARALAVLFMLLLPMVLGAVPARAQSPGNDIYFEIQDGDQNTDPATINTVTAEITTTSGDSETVTLDETDVDTGVFRASRRAVLDNLQIPDNDLIEVEPNDIITLSYEDVFNTTGSPVTVTDSVTVLPGGSGQLYTISVIALQPRLLPGGGLEADILASPRDAFGIPAVDGTPVGFSSSVGAVNPSTDTTEQGVAQTLFTSQTIINPSVITATVSRAQGSSSGSVSLTTNVSTTTTTSTNNTPLNEPPDIDIPGPTNNTANNTTNNTPPTIGNEVNNSPSPIPPRPEQTGQTLGDRLRAFFASEAWQQVAEFTDRVFNPIVAGVGALNLVLATTITSWYPFLLRIFLEPAQLLFKRGRRRPWGVVYNSLTKQPIDLAIVRLLDQQGKLINTKVTDRYGRYGFLVQPGTYRLTVTKPTFTYPSELLKGTPSDENFSNLYYGKEFTVSGETVINSNIPIDPPEAVPTVASVLRRYFKNGAHKITAYSGLVLGVIAVAVVQSWLSVVLLALHVIVFALFVRLARGKKIPRWGVAFDRETQQALGHTVVRIYDGKYNRVLEQQVADNSGRFGFLVGRSAYFLDAVKAGYRFPPTAKTKSRDYIGGMIYVRDPESAVAVDLPLDKAASAVPSAPGEPPATGTPLPRAPLNPAAPTGPIAPSGPTV